MLEYLSADIIYSKKRASEAQGICELRLTDNVQGKISEHIFLNQMEGIVFIIL